MVKWPLWRGLIFHWRKVKKVKEPFSYSERRRGAHPLYRSKPAQHGKCQCTGHWTRVSQRVRYLPQTQGLLLIHNPSAEWTEAAVHELLAQDHDSNCHSRESNPGLSSKSPTIYRLSHLCRVDKLKGLIKSWHIWRWFIDHFLKA